MPALCRICGANDLGRSERGARNAKRGAIPRSPCRAPRSALLAALWLLSGVALLAAPPAITTQPQKRIVIEGTSYTFTVAATGTAPLNYQWRRNTSNLAGQTNFTQINDEVFTPLIQTITLGRDSVENAAAAANDQLGALIE